MTTMIDTTNTYHKMLPVTGIVESRDLENLLFTSLKLKYHPPD